MKKTSLKNNTTIALIFFVASLILRIIPVSRPLQWYWRPLLFWRALKDMELQYTFQSGHPGVFNMWLSGFGATAYKLVTGFPEDVGYARTFNWSAQVPEKAVFFANLPLVIFVALANAASFFLIKRVFGKKAAIIATILLTIEPFLIAQAQVLHLDSPTAALMLLASLTIIIYVKENKKKFFFLSAFFAGLAILNRTSALFLLPYFGLCNLLTNFLKFNEKTAKQTVSAAFRAFKKTIIWASIAGVVFFLFYPALWVTPGEALLEIWKGGIERPVTQVHPHSNYFLGKLGKENFGALYYALAVLYLSAPITFLGTLASIGVVKAKKNPWLLLVWAYLFFFFIEVSLVAKQGYRYFAPFFPMLCVAAGVGLAFLIEKVKNKKLALFLLSAAVTWQLLLSLQNFPYFGTFFNPLFGGHSAAAFVFPLQDQGEGIAEAEKYLTNLEGNTAYKVACVDLSKETCLHTFKGKVAVMSDPKDSDYLIFDRNKVARDLAGQLWEEYKNKKPLKIISFDNISYVWIFER